MTSNCCVTMPNAARRRPFIVGRTASSDGDGRGATRHPRRGVVRRDRANGVPASRPKGLRPGPSVILSGWLYRTTTFVAARAMRSERRRVKREQETLSMPSNQHSPNDWSRFAKPWIGRLAGTRRVGPERHHLEILGGPVVSGGGRTTRSRRGGSQETGRAGLGKTPWAARQVRHRGGHGGTDGWAFA